ncbi:hypothetical protein MNBD_GAMMA11-1814 [hydrothermal vent metagenome]|uniref:BNR repeat domain protein n=1 Tax=hydrothermal vent metagenome TaxID=652676 RepID=A0A3B0XYJ1_9ZZZZ
MNKYQFKKSSDIQARVILYIFTGLIAVSCIINAGFVIAKPAVNKTGSHVVVSIKNRIINKLITVNNAACILLDNGKVYCWGEKATGNINLKNMSQVDLGGSAFAKEIYGVSVDMGEFDTGYHACAILRNNDIRCWGQYIDDIFDYEEIFEKKLQPDSVLSKIPSFKVKDEIVRKMDHPVKIITNAGVVCSINQKNKLFCPHQHLAFLNGEKDIKSAVFGEVLACLHKISGEVECYDMRGDADKKAITVSFNGELSPKQFVSRIIYSWGTCIIDSESQLACQEGEYSGDTRYSYIYNIETKKMTLPDKSTSVDIQLTDTHACVLQSSGNVYCWGNNNKGQLGPVMRKSTTAGAYVPFPGNRMQFSSGKTVKNMALGHGFSCFHIDNKVECFGQISGAGEDAGASPVAAQNEKYSNID